MVMSAQNCKLCVILPHRLDPEFCAKFDAVVQSGQVACAMHRFETGLAAPDQTLRDGCIASAQAYNVAFLLSATVQGEERTAKDIEELIAAVATSGADGVHIPAKETLYKAVREALGQERIVGVGGIANRHDAMVLGELGADYIAFGSSSREMDRALELVSWWAPLFEVPCIAWDVSTPDHASTFAHAGADFVAVGEAWWRQTDTAGGLEAIGAFHEAVRHDDATN